MRAGCPQGGVPALPRLPERSPLFPESSPPFPQSSPLFAATPPFASHRLPVGDGHVLHVEECGRPGGLPVIFLHGGPGSGCTPGQRRLFDPGRFRAVLFDQRGCGRSTPAGSLRANTTAHLVADIDRIRHLLGIERWLVFGGSWGSLLALAYAQAHPDAVSGLVLRGIFLGSAAELRRYAQGVATPAPHAWQRFAHAVPLGERDDLLGAYTRRLLSRDAPTRVAAARHWLDYERALMGEAPLVADPDTRQLAKTRIQAYYLSQGCFSDADRLLGGCERLRYIPGAVVQGSADPVCPPQTAERLHRAWPQAERVMVAGAGHGALQPAIAAACIAALDRIARRAAA